LFEILDVNLVRHPASGAARRFSPHTARSQSRAGARHGRAEFENGLGSGFLTERCLGIKNQQAVEKPGVSSEGWVRWLIGRSEAAKKIDGHQPRPARFYSHHFALASGFRPLLDNSLAILLIFCAIAINSTCSHTNKLPRNFMRRIPMQSFASPNTSLTRFLIR
jgi:hypothetical protein